MANGKPASFSIPYSVVKVNVNTYMLREALAFTLKKINSNLICKPSDFSIIASQYSQHAEVPCLLNENNAHRFALRNRSPFNIRWNETFYNFHIFKLSHYQCRNIISCHWWMDPSYNVPIRGHMTRISRFLKVDSARYTAVADLAAQ